MNALQKALQVVILALGEAEAQPLCTARQMAFQWTRNT